MEKFIVFQDMEHVGLVYDLLALTEAAEEQRSFSSDQEDCYRRCVSTAVELGESYGLRGNLWHCVLALLLANSENVFSRAYEKGEHADGTILELAKLDFARLRTLFVFDVRLFDEMTVLRLSRLMTDYRSSTEDGHIINTRVRDRICALGQELAAADSTEAFTQAVVGFYREFGVGTLGLHKAFRIGHTQAGEPFVQPITCTEHVWLSDLVGYERQKKRLVDNTRAFVEGREANNVLLYGDAGTGKSSCIKAVMNEFYGDGLRLIEVYRHQFRDLPRIIAQIKGRNYRFILYMDDLSFEEFETEYKYLKAVIEGGLENKPGNILIYATSNRRHLVRESFDDKKDYSPELHSSDTVQEKLSLVARFGVAVYFGAPDKEEYHQIVRTLAAREGVAMEEKELLLGADQWELRHGGRSGRCARQYIIWLKGQAG